MAPRFLRLLEIAQTARNRRQKHRRDDQDRSKFHKYKNLCLRNQAKRLEKLLFPATNAAASDGIAHGFFFLLHWQRLLFSHSKNNFSTTLTPTEKPRYTYFRVFFCRFYLLQKTIDIIRKIIFFSIFTHMCKAGDPDNGTILQVAL